MTAADVNRIRDYSLITVDERVQGVQYRVRELEATHFGLQVQLEETLVELENIPVDGGEKADADRDQMTGEVDQIIHRQTVIEKKIERLLALAGAFDEVV